MRLQLLSDLQAANPNLVWLDSSAAELHGFNFLGAPLWFPRAAVNERIKYGMTYFTAIEDFETWVFIERRPRLWLHGHSHASMCVQIGETTVLSNPFGYAGEALNPEFVDRLVVEV